MKTRYYLTVLCLIIGLSSVDAKVIRVNNLEPSNPAENTFSSLEEAYNSAVSGDTLYIEGSNVAYGSLTIAKRLVFIGPGYFLSENEGLSANKLEATVHTFTLANGSSGSKIMGLSFSQNNLARINLSVGNIEIIGCYFIRNGAIDVNLSNLENLVVQGNYFSSGAFSMSTLSSFQPPKNFLFSNNIVEGNFSMGKDNSTGTITNNLFRGSNVSFWVGSNANLQIHNNILLSTNLTNVVMPEQTGSNISHNISVSTQFLSTNNNQPNTTEADIFVTGENTLDGKYRIRTGGPADKKGKDGMDIGPFGGPRPYKLSGIPDLPVIYDLSSSGFGTADDKLPVTIKVRAN